MEKTITFSRSEKVVDLHNESLKVKEEVFESLAELIYKQMKGE